MDRTYTIAQLAQMSMLTDRTLRNYLKRGLLHGEKTAEGWRFSSEDIAAFWQVPAVRRAMDAKYLAVTEDFLYQRADTSGQACFILDEAVHDQRAADALCAAYCRAYRRCPCGWRTGIGKEQCAFPCGGHGKTCWPPFRKFSFPCRQGYENPLLFQIDGLSAFPYNDRERRGVHEKTL